MLEEMAAAGFTHSQHSKLVSDGKQCKRDISLLKAEESESKTETQAQQDFFLHIYCASSKYMSAITMTHDISVTST